MWPCFEARRENRRGIDSRNSDSDHSQMGRFVLRAHLHKHAGYFVPNKLNVVRQLDCGLEAELGANRVATASIAQIVSRPESLSWISGRNRIENQRPLPAADSHRFPR